MMPRSACVAALVLIPVLRIALSGLIPGLGLRGLGARWLWADADVAVLVLGMSAACAPWAWQAARSQGCLQQSVLKVATQHLARTADAGKCPTRHWK